MRKRLLLLDRIKAEHDTFLAPLMPALNERYETRFIAVRGNEGLAEAIGWSDIVWLEWCWDHAVWVTGSNLLAGRPCVVRLHSIEALQTDFPARVDWTRVSRLIAVGEDIAETMLIGFPNLKELPRPDIVPNGIDMARFAFGRPDPFRIGWVGHLEPKKNPMLMVQIMHRLIARDPRYSLHVAGAFTDARTTRYLHETIASLGLDSAITFEGHIADMPSWYLDKGVILCTSMYESFGLNIGEAMAVGAFPVVHAFPGAARIWPGECLFDSIDEAVDLIVHARPGEYRDWVGRRYGLDRQISSVMELLSEIAA
jgi:glycosyltransferase involved in cell wall biosynthesis